MAFGEGLVTPAISVLSAVEGLKIATDTFDGDPDGPPAPRSARRPITARSHSRARLGRRNIARHAGNTSSDPARHVIKVTTETMPSDRSGG